MSYSSAIEEALKRVPKITANDLEAIRREADPQYFSSIKEQIALLDCYLGGDGFFHPIEERNRHF